MKDPIRVRRQDIVVEFKKLALRVSFFAQGRKKKLAA